MTVPFSFQKSRNEAYPMATSRLLKIHINKGKAIAQTITQTITNRTDYAENPLKTRHSELVTGYEYAYARMIRNFLWQKRNISISHAGSKRMICWRTISVNHYFLPSLPVFCTCFSP